jgi:hypothetical protein
MSCGYYNDKDYVALFIVLVGPRKNQFRPVVIFCGLKDFPHCDVSVSLDISIFVIAPEAFISTTDWI